MHGVPFTVKDSFDTAGVVTTGGTLGRKDFVPGTDATVVARARAAGAILLGKTNTPEFTLGGGGKGTVNLVYGLTKNPYDVELSTERLLGRRRRDRRGSRGLLRHRLGLRRLDSRPRLLRTASPASSRRYGRVPRTGHIVGYGGAFDTFQETGPLARRVEDLALLMPILSGPDDWDAAMAPVPLGDPAAVEPASRCASPTTRRTATVDPTPEMQATVTQTIALLQEARREGHRGPAAEDEGARGGAPGVQRRPTAASTCGAC